MLSHILGGALAAAVLSVSTSTSDQAAHAGQPQQSIEAARSSMFADPVAALSHANEALASPGSTLTDLETATALWLKADATMRLGDPDEALVLASSARSSLRASDPSLSADIAMTEARALSLTGQAGRALLRLQEAHEAFRGVEDREGQAKALTGMAVLFQEAGRLDQALRTYTEAASQAAGTNLLFAIQHNRAGVYRDLGQYALVLRTFEDNLVALPDSSVYMKAPTLIFLADTSLRLGDNETARRHFEAAAAFRSDPALAPWRPFHDIVDAQLAASSGDVARARAIYTDFFQAIISKTLKSV